MTEGGPAATRRAWLRATGAAVTAGGLAGLGGLTGGVAAQQSGPTVAGSDSRITLSNDAIAATIERSDLTSDGKELICSRVGTRPGEDLIGTVGSVYKSPISNTESPRAKFRELLGFGVAEQTDDAVAYQTVARYEVFEDSRNAAHPIEVSYRVTLQGSDPFVLIDHRIENVGQGSIRIDQDPADIHDGMQVHSHLQLRDPSSRSDYGYVLSNGRGSKFGSVGRWRPQGAAQWGTLYDANTALTAGYLDGSTSPKMWITTGNPTDGLDFLVGEVTLDTDQTVTYRTLLSVDSLSGDPQQHGGDTVSSATDRAASTPQQFADAGALSTPSGGSGSGGGPPGAGGTATGGTPSGGGAGQTTVGVPGLEGQEGSSGGDGADDGDSAGTDRGGIPVLNRFVSDGDDLPFWLGLLAAVGGSGYLVYRFAGDDGEEYRPTEARQQAGGQPVNSDPHTQSHSEHGSHVDHGSEDRVDSGPVGRADSEQGDLEGRRDE